MRLTRKTVSIVAALALGAVGLTGCGTLSKPSVPKPAQALKAAPSTSATAPTHTLPPGSVAIAGFQPERVASAARFAEKFALAAMSGCDTASVQGLQHLMTPDLFRAALKNPQSWTVLTLDPPTVLAAHCVTSQKLTAGRLSEGVRKNGMPSIRVKVTVTEGLMVGTTASPNTLKPATVTRDYTVDVLPSGTKWLAQTITTSATSLTMGK